MVMTAIAISRAAAIAMTLAIPIAACLAMVTTMPYLDQVACVVVSLFCRARRHGK
jgi:hypothetical protein